MSKLDHATLRAGILESIEEMERQANDPALPRSVRNKMAWAAMRRRQLVARYPQFFNMPNSETDTRGTTG